MTSPSPERVARWCPLPASFVPWLVGTAVVVTALAVAGAHAPARIKLLGLYALGWGALAGGAIGLLARTVGGPRKGVVFGVSLLVVAAGEGGMTALSYRLYLADVAEGGRFGERDLLERRFLNQRGLPAEPEVQAQYEQMREDIRKARAQRERRRRAQRHFTAFLKLRVSSLGDWPSPWPSFFWGGEVLLGSLAGALVARRAAKRAESSDEDTPTA